MRNNPSGSEVGRVILNAPSPLPNRVRLFHTPPSWVKSGGVFFLTICGVPRGRNQLATDANFLAVTNALEHYVRAEKLWAHLLLAMPDHLHALLSFPIAVQMERTIRDWKRYLAKTAGIAWQDGFFDHRPRHDESFQEKARYIRMNPVRGGLAAHAEEWPYVWPTSVTPEAAR